ncbi:hypothetical protein [Deinococcus yavapaiensis]|uniref:Bifunctional DNA primase/polymerase-like protein n=1 Tax=Deinococcus yavapaiensis KR-236 TaxID=694435 RepID=A0A318S3L9_9DEIO|nr:hypothetical protein [Deinococcus yavapaiensis]PYE52982.1 hypothetical protein DES52_111155 [Deinococcus yavapaiensis KR-236]
MPNDRVDLLARVAARWPLHDARWVVWAARRRPNGGVAKVPLLVRGRQARAHDVRDAACWMTWDALNDAFARRHVGTGVGYALHGSGLACVDLDACVAQDGRIAPWAVSAAQEIGGYVERSPGSGVHVLVRDETHEASNAVVRLASGRRAELLRTGHVTVTGRAVPPWTAWPTRLFDVRLLVPTSPTAAPPRITSTTNVDAAIACLRRLRNGAKFAALFDDGVCDGYASRSEAAFALLRLAHFVVGDDPVALDAVFRRSALHDAYAGKWARRVSTASPVTIGERTIARVIALGGPVLRPARD